MRLVTIFALAGLCATASAANLFSNPGFETSTTGWTLYLQSADSVTATANAVAGAGHNGSAGMQIGVTKVSSQNWHIQLQTPQDWNAIKGKTYKLSFWAKADASKSIHLGVGLGPAANYAYLEGTDFGLSTAWKQIELEYTSPATGVDSLRFNIFVGGATGTYTFDDFSLDTLSSSQGGNIVQPATGAWYSGNYRNLFVEIGKTPAEVDTKVNNAFQQLFFGDSATESVYRQVGTDEAYIEAIDSKDIRTEGQSYGMMIAVMMDRQDVFNKLWKFAKQKMQLTSGAGRGYFSWQVQTSNFASRANGAAPDGEEYFVSALYLADKRWGSATGVANFLNYRQQADSILQYMLPGRTGQGPMFDTTRAQVLFITDVNYTDPSYHLPAFYRMWGEFASHHNGLWKRMADTSIAFLRRSWDPVTGLNPKFTTFEGVPMPSGTNNDADANIYATDAHRTPMNYGVDWSWFKSDTSIQSRTKTLLDFFYNKGISSYTQSYTLDGTAKTTYAPAQSQIGSNAVAVLASNDNRDYAFVEALWKTALPAGQWRYYNGMIQMLSLLHVSGKFKAYGSPGMNAASLDKRSQIPSLRIRSTGRSVTVEGAMGAVRLLDATGREILRSEATGTQASFTVAHRGIWLIDAGASGTRTIVVP